MHSATFKLFALPAITKSTASKDIKCEPVCVCKTCKSVFVVVRARQYCCADCNPTKRNNAKQLITKQCDTCSKEFEISENRKRDKNRKYCSWKCSGEAERQYKSCPRCNSEFVGQTKYCSPKCVSDPDLMFRNCTVCNNRFEKQTLSSTRKICVDCHDKREEENRIALASRYCIECGKTIKFKNTDSHKVRETRIYCSTKCRSDANRKPVIETKIAKQCKCGSSFKTSYSKQKYCSKECQYQYAQCIPTQVAKCKDCGREFFRGGGINRKKLYCSDDCLKRASHRTGKASRRAMMKGVEYERFDPVIVLERDGWQCYLCGVDTPRILRGTCEPNAPELEHIIALANGGAHTMDNTACACRKCNGLKAANDNYVPQRMAA